MFEGFLTSFSSLKPITIKVAIAAIILSGFLLFFPAGLLDKLGLKELVDGSKAAIGMLFVFSASVVFAEGVFLVGRTGKKLIEEARYRANMKKFLGQISGDEKAVLKSYIEHDVATKHFSISSGIGQSLEAKGILTRSSNFGVAGSGDCFPYFIQPVAKAELLRNPSVLD